MHGSLTGEGVAALGTPPRQRLADSLSSAEIQSEKLLLILSLSATPTLLTSHSSVHLHLPLLPQSPPLACPPLHLFLSPPSSLSSMSDAQLQKLQLERDALAAELRLVQSAIPPSKASGMLMQAMANKPDPFIHAPGAAGAEGNEWVNENSGDRPCCTIM